MSNSYVLIPLLKKYGILDTLPIIKKYELILKKYERNKLMMNTYKKHVDNLIKRNRRRDYDDIIQYSDYYILYKVIHDKFIIDNPQILL